MIGINTILKTNEGLEFEITEVISDCRYKAKCNNLALFISVRGNIIVSDAEKFLGSIKKVNYILEGEYIDEQDKTINISR